MCALPLLAVVLVSLLAISVVSDADVLECYICEQCNAEQPWPDGVKYPTCPDGQYCSMLYSTNGPFVTRRCMSNARYQEISRGGVFNNAQPMQCATVMDKPSTYECICQGKLCNWFPISSILTALENLGTWPEKRKPIPARIPSSSKPAPSVSSGNRPSGQSGSGGSAGTISKPATPSGSGGTGAPVNPSGSTGTGGSSSAGSQSGSGSSGGPAPPSGSGGSESGSGSGSSGTGTGEGAGESGGAAEGGSGEGGQSGGGADGGSLDKSGEGSGSGGNAVGKGGTGAAGGSGSGSGSGSGTTGNGTDSAAAQGSGSSLGLIAGIVGGLVAVSAIGGGVYYWHKNKQAKQRDEEDEDEGEGDEED